MFPTSHLWLIGKGCCPADVLSHFGNWQRILGTQATVVTQKNRKKSGASFHPSPSFTNRMNMCAHVVPFLSSKNGFGSKLIVPCILISSLPTLLTPLSECLNMIWSLKWGSPFGDTHTSSSKSYLDHCTTLVFWHPWWLGVSPILRNTQQGTTEFRTPTSAMWSAPESSIYMAGLWWFTLWWTNILPWEIHHFYWENPLFLWPFSIAFVGSPEGMIYDWLVVEPYPSEKSWTSSVDIPWHSHLNGNHGIHEIWEMWQQHTTTITGWWCNNHLEKWWSSSLGRMEIPWKGK